MKTTLEIIRTAMAQARKPCLAVSGGTDSLVLLDILSAAGHKIPLVHADSQMEYPETQDFLERTAAKYGTQLYTARARRTPEDQWRSAGWPMLGKLAAREWTKKNGASLGFKINCSECCRTMKINPARRLVRNIGCDLQFTGQRGGTDDAIRRLRTIKDGAIFYNDRDRLWIANPLTGWTDLMIRRYVAQHNLELHPMRARGAISIGCAVCGGGARYTNSPYRALRQARPEIWRRFMVEQEGGLVILALKHETDMATTRAAVEAAGGLTALVDTRPWVFDFARTKPLPGYDK